MNYELKVMEQQAAEAARLSRRMSRSLRSRIDTKSNTNRLRGLDNLLSEWRIWNDQRGFLRKELRLMHLARAYLSGKKYLEVENKTWNPVDEWEVWNIIDQPSVSREDVARWLEGVD